LHHDRYRAEQITASARNNSKTENNRGALRLLPVLLFRCSETLAKLGVSSSSLILQSKQANVMCITLAVSAKVSAWLPIASPAFWWHSDASDRCRRVLETRRPFLTKDSIDKRPQNKKLIQSEAEYESLLGSVE